MEPNKKAQDDPKKEQTNPAQEEVQKQMAELMEQNKALLKQLQEKEAKEKQAKEDAEKAKLDRKTSLSNILDDLEKGDEDDYRASKSGLDLDALSNKEMVEVMTNAMEEFLSANISKVKEESSGVVDTLKNELKKTQEALGSMLVKQQINDMAVKYPDFNDLREDIAKVVEEIPGISIEKAYKLARAERRDTEPPVDSLESEYPGIPPRRPVQVRESEDAGDKNAKKPVSRGGMADFRKIVARGAERVLQNKRT